MKISAHLLVCLAIGGFACGCKKQPPNDSPNKRRHATPPLQLANVSSWPKSTAPKSTTPTIGIVIAQTGISVDGETVAPIANYRIDAKHKGGAKPKVFSIGSLRKALDQRVRKAKPLGATASLSIDPEIPYRVVSDVMYTASQAKIGNVSFVVRTPAGLRVLAAHGKASFSVVGAKPKKAGPNLNVGVTRDGYRLTRQDGKGNAGKILPRITCLVDADSGDPVSRDDTRVKRKVLSTLCYDRPGLYAWLYQVKQMHPNENVVTVTADPRTKWRHVAKLLATMMFVRTPVSDGKGIARFPTYDAYLKSFPKRDHPLFPHPVFSVY